MLGRSKVVGLVTLLVVLALFVTGIQAAGLPDLEPSDGGAQFADEEAPPEEPPAEEPPPEEPPAEEPPAEEPPAEEPKEGDKTTIIIGKPGKEEAAPAEPAPADPMYSGQGLLWLGIFAVGIFIIIGVVAIIGTSGGGKDAPTAQVISVPITTVADDIKQGKISRIVVYGEQLRITRTDGVEMISRKEPAAEITTLLTNLGVPPERLSAVVIDVEPT